jgi:hypothetical protein
LSVAPLAVLLRNLEKGDIDFALVSAPPGLPDTIRAEPAYRERYMVVFPPGHRFERFNTIALADVNEPHDVFHRVQEGHSIAGCAKERAWIDDSGRSNPIIPLLVCMTVNEEIYTARDRLVLLQPGVLQDLGLRAEPLRAVAAVLRAQAGLEVHQVVQLHPPPEPVPPHLSGGGHHVQQIVVRGRQHGERFVTGQRLAPQPLGHEGVEQGQQVHARIFGHRGTTAEGAPGVRWTMPGAPVHFAFGFTGNGVGPSQLVGRALASLALDRRDEHTRLPIVDAGPGARVPPEPLAWLGGSLVRGALIRCERAAEQGGRGDPLSRAICAAPRAVGIHLGR